MYGGLLLIILIWLSITSPFQGNHFKILLSRLELLKSSEYSREKGLKCFISMRSKADYNLHDGQM